MDWTAEIERRYRERERAEVARGARLFTVLAALLFPAFAVLDVLTQPQAAPSLLRIRSATTLVFVVLYLLPRRVLASRPYLAALVQLEISAASITAMCLVLDGYRSAYYAGVNLVAISAGLLFPWSARWMAAVVTMIIGTYTAGVLAREGFVLDRPDLLVNNLYFLLATGVISVASSHLGDRLRRDSFRQFLQVETAREDLRHQDEIKSRFFANVSHELRTPLTLILGPVRALLDNPGGPAEARTNLEVIDRNARVLLGQVNDLLDVARLDARVTTLEPQAVDLAELVRRVASQFEAASAERGHTLTVEAPAALPAKVDPAKVERVLRNLIANAFKFTPAPGRIHCAMARGTEGTARITVADSGPGIAPEFRERVFDRFFQIESSETRRHGGTGLGLAIVRELVQLHRGAIRAVESPLGGAQFEVTLPLEAPAGAMRPSPHPPAPDPLQVSAAEDTSSPPPAAPVEPDASDRALVLVVEDNADMNAFVQGALARRFRVAAAFDGRAGVEQARRLRPDLVITDVMMPGMSGLELLRELRSIAEVREIPVVVLTARADDTLRLDLLRNGAQDTLLKPFGAEELLARVSNLVELSRSREILRTQLDAAQGGLETMARDVARRTRELRLASRELEAARDQAVRALRLREEFISIASHELRTPLTSLKLIVQLAQRRQQQEAADPQATRALLERLPAQVRRLARLIEEMLDFSRMQSGRLELKRAPMDLVRIVHEVVEEFADRSADAGAPVEVRAPEKLIGDWDAFRLEQVVGNLLSNALKYGGGKPVLVEVEDRDEAALFSVRDSGMGIPADEQARIFEPFERAVSSREISGFGLGLYIARQVVEAHGGSIAVASAPGQGASFSVQLPRTAAPPPARALGHSFFALIALAGLTP